VGGRIDILGKNQTFSWGPYNLFNRRLANASGGFPSLTPAAASSAVAAPVGRTADGATSARSAQARYVAPPVILDPATVDASDFVVDGLGVSDAVVRPDGSTVRLTTTAQTRDQTYDVVVAAGSVKDQGGAGVLASNAGFLAYRPPRIAGAANVDTNTVDVVFDAHTALDTSTVEAADFTVPGLPVSAASVQPDGKTVRLTTSDQSKGTTYTVSVSDGAVSDSIHPGEASNADFPGYWPPYVTGAKGAWAQRVDVFLDTRLPIDGSTLDTSDFSVPGLTITSVGTSSDRRTIRLFTAETQTRGVTYTVTVVPASFADDEGYLTHGGAQSFPAYWPTSLVSAATVDGTTVDVLFDSRGTLSPPTVLAASFAATDAITGDPLAVTAATLQPDGRTVRLTTAPQSKGATYSVTTAGTVRDTYGNWGIVSSAAFPGYWQPAIASASAVDSTTVDVLFDSRLALDPGSVGAADFALANPAVPETTPVVAAATVQPDGRTVRITTAPNLYPQRLYDVSVGAASVTDGMFDGVASSATFTAVAPTFSMTSVATPFARPATVVRFANPSQGYITYTWGEVAYTSNGGATWVNRRLFGAPASNMHVRDISFVGGDPLKPVAIGWGGLIQTSTNAGTSWTNQTGAAGAWPLPLGADTNHLWTVDFADATKGYIGGSGMNMFQGTANGGTSWAAHSQSATIPVGGAWGIDNRWVRFAPGGAKGWYAVGDRILGTSNGGVTWGQQYSGAPGYFACVHAHDAQRAWAVGTAGMIVRTSDGGATWQVQPSGTTQNLSGVAFTDAYNGFAVGANSTVLHTWDGGLTWSTLTPPVTALIFDSTTFADPEHAWIVGYLNGTTPRVLKAVPQW
jgi:photosystem II stability/assembly factor-like uncharacterized protein